MIRPTACRTRGVITFDKGHPGRHRRGAVTPLEAIQEMNRRAPALRVSAASMVEDRAVGIKSHPGFTGPSAVALIEAHQALESR